MNFSAADYGYMAQALRLAERGLYTTSPNPRVGCVLVSDGRVIGEGWHEKAGEPHAEVHALRAAAAAGEDVRGATAYVTLEPCSHHGRTPPCAEALVAAGVARVVAAMQDPNPLVAGRGLARLAAAGIATACGLLAAEARELNIGFVSRMTRGRPWVRLKAAASLDGRTALGNGKSQWITGSEARQDGHRWRARACALMTGVGTVRDDDPQLNVRGIEMARQPLKIIVDSRLETPPSARILQAGHCLLAGVDSGGERAHPLRAAGAEILAVPADERGKVDLAELMKALGNRGLNEVHLEAGWRLNGSFLRAGLVDEILLYLAPCLLGHAAHGLFDLHAMTRLEEKISLELREIRQLGGDIRILARPSGAW